MKKASLALIPDNWKLGKISDFGKVITGSTPQTSDPSNYGDEIPFVTPKEVGHGRYVGYTSRKLSLKGATKARVLPTDSILFVCIGSTIGKVSQIIEESATNQQINSVSCLDGYDAGFLYYQLDFRANHIRQLAGKQAVPIVNKTLFEQVPVLYPPLPEQKKIAEILGASVEAIEAQQKLIELKEKRLKGWMQKLLTGKVRFPQFAKSSWVDEELGNLIKHVFRPIELNPDAELNLVSVRRRSGGIFKRPSIKGNDYKTKDLHELKENDLLISKRQVTHGALALVVREYAGCLVSKEYTIFENISPSSIHMGFLGWLSKMPRFWHLAYLASNGVVIEKLIFVPKDFLRNKIFLPRTVKEQEEISCFLCELESELNLEKDKLSQLKLQKKSLMQKLLTGKVRVKVDDVEDSR